MMSRQLACCFYLELKVDILPYISALYSVYVQKSAIYT